MHDKAEPPRPIAPIAIDTPHFQIRFLTVDDATDRWPAWFEAADVRESINLAVQPKSREDMVTYIRGFDQKTSMIVGAFEKATGLLVCIGTAHIDWRDGNYIINTIVGEAKFRNAGVMTELTPPFRDYFFEKLGLRLSTATALGTNTVIRRFLEATGWSEVQVVKNHVRRHSDGAMIDLHIFRLTREAWQAWKAKNLPTAA